MSRFTDNFKDTGNQDVKTKQVKKVLHKIFSSFTEHEESNPENM